MRYTHWPRYSSKILEMLHKCDTAAGSSAVSLLGNPGLKAIYFAREEAAKPSRATELTQWSDARSVVSTHRRENLERRKHLRRLRQIQVQGVNVGESALDGYIQPAFSV